MTPNIENISRVQAAILAEPHLFDMREWCGTVRCIGGWCNVLEASDKGLERVQMNKGDAAEFLGLSFDDASDLFYPRDIEEWTLITPEIAVAHLEHIKSGNPVDWSLFVTENG